MKLHPLRQMVWACALFLALPAASAWADDPDFIAFSAGAFDIGKDQTAAEGRLEYRSDIRLWIFKPFAGVMGTSDGGAYGYAGVLVDVFFGNRIVSTISFAPGAYARGDGKDLGHDLEFRSQLEVAYRFEDRARLGLSISHMSNASIGDKNPGAESLMLTYALPVGNLFGD
ncbi:MAG: acyloxyacyl hydrolase [Alphaproteobacteria bacterium]|nr:acyloxyacyl hydrolase [Alphaproteobacteria bacterium]